MLSFNVQEIQEGWEQVVLEIGCNIQKTKKKVNKMKIKDPQLSNPSTPRNELQHRTTQDLKVWGSWTKTCYRIFTIWNKKKDHSWDTKTANQPRRNKRNWTGTEMKKFFSLLCKTQMKKQKSGPHVGRKQAKDTCPLWQRTYLNNPQSPVLTHDRFLKVQTSRHSTRRRKRENK